MLWNFFGFFFDIVKNKRDTEPKNNERIPIIENNLKNGS